MNFVDKFVCAYDFPECCFIHHVYDAVRSSKKKVNELEGEIKWPDFPNLTVVQYMGMAYRFLSLCLLQNVYTTTC